MDRASAAAHPVTAVERRMLVAGRWSLPSTVSTVRFWLRRLRVRPADCLVATALLTILIVAVFERPIDHDESQYVAATVLARHLRLYRDFDYLQTPLQPILLSPLTAWIPLPPMLLLRLCNAALAWLAALTLGKVVGRIAMSRLWGWMAACLLAVSEPFLFAASTARNDALPLLCLCVGIGILLRLGKARGRSALVLSVILGAVMAGGAAAKISYALPAAAIGAVELLGWQRARRWPVLLGYGSGVAAVAIWCLVIASAAIDRAAFDILVFPTGAPAEYYGGLGQTFCLTFPGRLLALAKFALLGPGPILAAAMLMPIRRNRAEYDAGFPDRFHRHLWTLFFAGLAAALLPAPLWRQYLLPIFPPLICLAIPALRSRWRSKRWRFALGISVVAGVSITVGQSGTAIFLGSPLLEMEKRSQTLSILLRQQAVHGVIASLAPEVVAEAGASPDPRFAAGPFLFRTRDALGMASKISGICESDAVARLHASPPAAILTGGDADTAGSGALDVHLAAIASQAGFHPVANLYGGFVLWKAPAGKV